MPRYWKVSGTGTWPVVLKESYSRDAIEAMRTNVPMIMISSK